MSNFPPPLPPRSRLAHPLIFWTLSLLVLVFAYFEPVLYQSYLLDHLPVNMSINTSPLDPNVFSNIHEIQTRHVHLDLKVNFEKKKLIGSATLTLEAVKNDVKQVILDTRALSIQHVFLEEIPLQFTLAPEDKKFGSALHIQLPQPLHQGTRTILKIVYETTSEGGALQWLEPSQTVGKQYPYLFTQCQAIHARSLLPVQDSPAIKLTYSASIHVPKPLKALMSALSTGETTSEDGKSTIYQFEQRITMPSYLIALVVGHLEGREIGPRSTVWSEPEVVEKAAWEFADTEKFIATGEALLTPYEWGRYDLLVLPGSFPYGGMENPCLTFVTPTLLAGDRSLVNVVAHEIAHSWMGNLVTTRNWEHFWLNEGWTVFIERKILGRLHGEPARQFASLLGVKELQKDIDLFGADNPLTALELNLTNVDPDDAFSRVPYEKGYNLLYYLEQLLGGPQVFEPYMKAYVKEFAGKSIDTTTWKTFLYTFMQTHYGESKTKLLDQVNWDAWLHQPGMPPVKNAYDTSLADACTALAERWHMVRHGSGGTFSPEDIKDFSPTQIVFFLEQLQEQPTWTTKMLDEMERVYQFTNVVNNEIRFRWQMLCLSAGYEPIYPHVVAFLKAQGRMKYVRPLYRALNQVHPTLARDTFFANRDTYHPIAARMIAKDILS